MIAIGTYNTLKVTGQNSNGLRLSDGETEILLPSAEVPSEVTIDDDIRVFVFVNKAGETVATTKPALAEVGDFAFLNVVAASEIGAFLDLGIDKDIFVPTKEQRWPMRKGEAYVVYLYLDEENERMLASTKLRRFIEEEDVDLEVGDEVDLLIAEETDLGFNAIIDNRYIGLLYHNELFANIAVGDKRKGWVKNITIAGKVDLSLQPQGFGHVLDTKEMLLRVLMDEGGRIPLGDKSDPEEIHDRFQISKKAFKKAIGGLYKEKRIILSDYEIKLIS
ncbi:CvfB family protein [Sphingobacterium gobiense]|uniref:RNA-binding protein n=1 Tax=Sphingobacterium gobiense TaxID=1382456 RepID=A0A2S9JGL4_9SPHI|nr:S1-like domain-containing RNA-binding protein [Sphingobacterium gobiense]PRD51971.1 RNA-binding protein [Sphingobacterium gobiense]